MFRAVTLRAPRPPHIALAVGAISAPVTRSLLLEAVRAIDRPVTPGLKRHPGLLAAARAGDREHLALPAVTAAAAAVTAIATPGLAVRAALRTARGFIREPARGEELLFTHGERERLAAVAAREG